MNISRTRERMEGVLSRRRNYVCTECKVKFQIDTLSPLPKIDRVCFECRERTFVYTFVYPNGNERQVRASNVELATLRAWAINKNLSFKG